MTGFVGSAQSEGLRTVMHRLSAAQKSNRGAPGYSRWINRPAGRFLAATAFKIGLSPNQVTLGSAAMSLLGITLVAILPATLATGCTVAILLTVAYALDSADGQLARLRGTGSAGGEWLDHVVDCVKSVTIHLAVLICWFTNIDFISSLWLLIPLAYCVQSVTWFFSITLTEQLLSQSGRRKSKSAANPREQAPAARSLAMLPVDYGVLCLSFFLLGYPHIFVAVYTILAVVNVAYLGLAMVRWYRSLTKPPTPVPARSTS